VRPRSSPAHAIDVGMRFELFRSGQVSCFSFDCGHPQWIVRSILSTRPRNAQVVVQMDDEVFVLTQQRQAAGDPVPPECEVIEVHVAELRQLFNAIDPSPFRDRDLDPRVEQFIVDWSREAPAGSPLALLVRLDRPANPADDAAVVRDSIHSFFANRAAASRGRLRHLFRIGRVSLAIGLAVLTTFLIAARSVSRQAGESGLSGVLHESLSIGGWVAMWRPLEIFLYDWWPIRAEARLFDRLAVMPVRLSYTTAGA
jgi:hypothetical protein